LEQKNKKNKRFEFIYQRHYLVNKVRLWYVFLRKTTFIHYKFVFLVLLNPAKKGRKNCIIYIVQQNINYAICNKKE